MNSGGIALLDWGGCTSLWNLLMVVVNTPEDPLPNLLSQKWGVFLAHYPSCFVTLCRMEMCWIHMLQAFKFASACQYHIPSYRLFSFCSLHLIASKKVAEGKKKFKVLDQASHYMEPRKGKSSIFTKLRVRLTVILRSVFNFSNTWKYLFFKH